MTLEFVPAARHHIPTIAERMRAADVEEVDAASGITPCEALEFSFGRSSLAVTALFGGRPEAMFGVGDVNVLAGIGAPWLLATDRAVEQQRLFLCRSRVWCGKLTARYALLRNMVHDRNEPSKRWIRWLGFTLGEPRPLGRSGEMFRVFEMRCR